MNGNLNTRKLSISDTDIYFNSWLNRNLLYDGENLSAPMENNNEQRSHVFNTLKSENIIVLGNFFEDQLVACVSLYLWKTLPFYTFFDYFTTRNNNIKFYTNSDQLFNHAFKTLESSQRYTFYMMTKLRAFQKSELLKKNQMTKIIKNIPSFSRYNIYVEELVQKGMPSHFQVHNDLMRNSKWYCPILIRKGCLKQEFRTSIIKNQLLVPKLQSDVQL